MTLSCSSDTSLLFLVSGSPVSTYFVQCMTSALMQTEFPPVAVSRRVLLSLSVGLLLCPEVSVLSSLQCVSPVYAASRKNHHLRWGATFGSGVRLTRHWGGATFGSVGIVLGGVRLLGRLIRHWGGATFGSAVRLLGRGGVCYYCMIIVYGQRAKLGGVLETGSKGYNLALL